MRTHLLRTFYPSPAIELDTGLAANDDSYAPNTNSAAAQMQLNPAVQSVDTKTLLDEYVLGGYAGI